MRSELQKLEREQKLSNDRAMADARRKLREKKRSEIARRLIEAQRLQVVMQRKQEEEEEKKRKRTTFTKDMTAVAEKHLKAASDNHSRLWKVLGLRRLNRNTTDEEMLLVDDGSPEHDRPLSKASRLSNNADLVSNSTHHMSETSEEMLKQREWMAEQVAFALSKAKAQAEQRAKDEAARARLSSAKGRNSPRNKSNVKTEILKTKRDEIIPELLDVKRQLRELGVETGDDYPSKHAQEPIATNLLIKKDEVYTLEARVQDSLQQLEQKEAKRAAREAHITAGDRGAVGDECMKDGRLMLANSELNQQRDAMLKSTVIHVGGAMVSPLAPPRTPMSQRLNPLEITSPVSNSLQPSSGESTPTPVNRQLLLGFRPELSGRDQKALDKVALSRAQQQEKFVANLRHQKEVISTYKEKLKRLEEEDAAANPNPQPAVDATDDSGMVPDSGEAATKTLEDPVASPEEAGKMDAMSEDTSTRACTEDAIAQEKELAAVVIQHAFKTAQCKQEIAIRRQRIHETRQIEAAFIIQRLWGCHAAKSRVHNRKAFQNRTAHLATTIGDAAAMVIVRFFRRCQHRHKVQRKQDDVRLQLQKDSATSIQALWRGHQCRKEFVANPPKRSAITTSMDDPESAPEVPLPQAEPAGTTDA